MGKLWKNLLIFALFFSLLIFGTNNVLAMCDPCQCGSCPQNICSSDEHCYDKCCIPNATPSPGGGNCPGGESCGGQTCSAG